MSGERSGLIDETPSKIQKSGSLMSRSCAVVVYTWEGACGVAKALGAIVGVVCGCSHTTNTDQHQRSPHHSQHTLITRTAIISRFAASRVKPSFQSHKARHLRHPHGQRITSKAGNLMISHFLCHIDCALYLTVRPLNAHRLSQDVEEVYGAAHRHGDQNSTVYAT